jgi:hypothetical protein
MLERQVQVVAHHRIAHDRDGEVIGENGDAVFNPLAAAVVVLARVKIVARSS